MLLLNFLSIYSQNRVWYVSSSALLPEFSLLNGTGDDP